MTRATLIIIALAGCGRLGFGDTGDAAGSQRLPDGALAIDAPADAAFDAPDAAPGNPELVAHYTMDGLVSTTTLVDSSGYGNTGRCIAGKCPGMSTGEVGEAMVFDGTNEEIDVQSSASLSQTGGLTVAAWFKSPIITDGETHCFLSKPVGAGVADSWQLCINAASELYGEIATTLTANVSLTSNSALTGTIWRHAALTWDGATLRLYLNGQVVSSAPAASLQIDAHQVIIGADSDNGAFSAGFQGGVDEVAIFSSALSAAEVMTLASQ